MNYKTPSFDEFEWWVNTGSCVHANRVAHVPSICAVGYREFNGKQKGVSNLQKVPAKLADYGFNCIKMDADFLAYHKDA